MNSKAGSHKRDRYNKTALLVAAREGNIHAVERLLENGVELDHAAKYGLTALMLAVIRGHTDVVRKLVDAGADLNLRGSGAPGFAGQTALDLAIALGHTPMIEILRDK